ncbi:serine-repeat antigen 3 (SERA) [Plasmodium vivax Mauritania I]|uniref:Serine-repeat antigen 3 (SERA) n=1 Tax=Plasmodium vivax Mauritania I TaxID=1035515 RepID=A0A0J9TJ97_PLAVI|nr:serine-repeat antigen 3 (SERA) [Plasmodium vivax Mauritania I]
MKSRICALLLIVRCLLTRDHMCAYFCQNCLFTGLVFVNEGARCASAAGGGPPASDPAGSAPGGGGNAAGQSRGGGGGGGSSGGASSGTGGREGVSAPGSSSATDGGGAGNSASLPSGTVDGGVGAAGPSHVNPGVEQGSNTAPGPAARGPEAPPARPSAPPAGNPSPPPHAPQQTSDPNAVSANPAEDATTPPSVTNPFKVKSSLLKDQKGLKITGPCESYFQVYLVPYLYMNVNATSSEIEMEPMFMKVDDKIKFEKEKHLLHNICAADKTFKLVLYMYDGVLTIKWKVYPLNGDKTADRTLDIRKYKMKDIGQPITSMQVVVMTEQNKTVYVESKNFSIMNEIPEKCDAIANECFMSGVLDVQKCYHCSLLLQKKENAQECFKFVSPKIKNSFDEIQAKGEDEENPNEEELQKTIDNIFVKVYKKGENLYKEVDQLAIIDSSFKSELLKYCSLMKEVDASGALDNHQLGDAEDVFAHITTMLHSNSDLDVFSLKSKLKNAALCLKNGDEWVGSKTGLALPNLSPQTFEDTPTQTVDGGDEQAALETGEDGVVDLASLQSVDVSPFLVTDKLFCNDDYCDRAKDTSSCVAKIEVQDQGDCATSWLFASKVHLETIKCVKGYDHVGASALYVANCSGEEANDKCHSPSNPLEFLNTLEETKFLPAESDLPYSYQAVNNVCPEPKSHWKNLWANVKLLGPTNEPNSVSTKGYTAYQSDHFKGNMDAFIKLVKSEVMKKGSVIAYVKAAGTLSYDLNGKKVLSLCGSETPDLAVNIVGYGNYISAEGVKKPYWLLQNSWGKHWGDKGTFKVDMHGPPGCQHNFIHTAAVFNLDIPVVVPTPNSDPEINNYYLKNSPDFFSNFYLNKHEAGSDGNSDGAKSVSGNSTVQGQDGPPATAGEVGAAAPAKGPTSLEPSQSVDGGSGQTGVVGANGKGQPGDVTSSVQGSTVVLNPSQVEDTRTASLPNRGVSGVASVQPSGDTAQSSLTTSSGTQNPSVTTGTTRQTNQQRTQQTTQEQTPKVPLSSLKGSTGVNVTEVKEALHFLKSVKNGKVKSNFVAYVNADAMGDEKVCSRAFSTDADKQTECIEFCEKNWDACKGKVSPGYCLTKKRGSNDCFFCFV